MLARVKHAGLLNSRINRRLLLLALGAAAAGAAVLGLVSGGLTLAFAVRATKQEVATRERDITRLLTGYASVDVVQEQLQLLVASGELLQAMVVSNGEVIASSDASQNNLPLATVARRPAHSDFHFHLSQCLPPKPRLDCFSTNLSFTDGPLPVLGGDHLLRFTKVPLALQNLSGHNSHATLITETDLMPSIRQAGMLGLWVFGAGLVALSLSSSVLVLVVRRQLLPELFDLAQTDSLSGVANRQGFDELARHRLDQAAASQVEQVLALIDVDRFKGINDSFGHAVGDAVVQEIATFLGQAVRSSDVVGRVGGDEFALLIDAQANQAAELLERLRAGVAAKAFALPDGRCVRLSLSIGMASTGGSGGYRLKQLMELADASLYAAKDLGRNQVAHLER